MNYKCKQCGGPLPDVDTGICFNCYIGVSSRDEAHPPRRDCDCKECKPSFDESEIGDGFYYSKKLPERTMTKDEAMKLALEWMETIVNSNWRNWGELASPEEFERWVKIRANHSAVVLRQSLEQPDAIEAAVLAEREACAKVADSISDKYAFGYYGNEVDTADEIAAAIRERMK